MSERTFSEEREFMLSMILRDVPEKGTVKRETLRELFSNVFTLGYQLSGKLTLKQLLDEHRYCWQIGHADGPLMTPVIYSSVSTCLCGWVCTDQEKEIAYQKWVSHVLEFR